MDKRPIPDYPDFLASDDGRIFNTRGMVMSCYLSGCGYPSVKLLHSSGKRKTCSVHRLVSAAFFGPIPPKMWVNHKDGNKLNNCVDNLEIGTPAYNHQHARDVLKRSWAKGTQTNAHLNDEAVQSMRKLNLLGCSHAFIAKAFLVSQSCVTNIVNGKSWQHLSLTLEP